jgi:hypothetical protein
MEKEATMEHGFKELDDLVLHLKGLVLVRRLRERSGADPNELGMFNTEIERVRRELALIAAPAR